MDVMSCYKIEIMNERGQVILKQNGLDDCVFSLTSDHEVTYTIPRVRQIAMHF